MKELEWRKTLGVSAAAGEDEIKEAYRRLAKKYHPDSAGNRFHTGEFVQITEAYRNLTSNGIKRKYIDFPVRNNYTGTAYRRPAKPPEPKEPDISDLGRILENGRLVGIRAFAARSLGNSGKRSAYLYLKKGLYDQDELVVKSTIEAIGNLGIRQCGGELGSAFSRGSASIRRTILNTVERIGPSDGFKSIILAGMRDSDPEVRIRSLRLFSRITA